MSTISMGRIGKNDLTKVVRRVTVHSRHSDATKLGNADDDHFVRGHVLVPLLHLFRALVAVRRVFPSERHAATFDSGSGHGFPLSLLKIGGHHVDFKLAVESFSVA